MLNINFSYLLNFLPIFLIFTSSFVSLVLNYTYHVKNTFYLKQKTKKKTITEKEISLIKMSSFNILFLYINFIYLNIKIPLNNFTHLEYYNNNKNPYYFLFFLLFCLYYSIIYLFQQYNVNYEKIINYNEYITLFFVLIIFLMLFIDNFFLFFFFLELLSYIFYLQFLQVFNKTKTNNNKNYYLDSILLFYWVNFFGSLFLVYSIMILFLNFNTSAYSEIVYLLNYKVKNNIFLIFFFVGLSIKLGVSGFHFLKIEVYKNLKIDSIINFSFLSIFGYLILLKLITMKIFIFYNFIYFLLFVNIFSVLFLLYNINLKNIILFFGYSAILNVSLALFIIA